MAELKTKENDNSVEAFLDEITDEKKREEAYKILKLMKQVTKKAPKMWGTNLIGFGSYHYKYESGREGDWFLTGFSPRKQNFTIYIMDGFERYEELLSQLGKHKTSKSCLSIKKLEDVDLKVLKELVKLSSQRIAKSNKS